MAQRDAAHILLEWEFQSRTDADLTYYVKLEQDGGKVWLSLDTCEEPDGASGNPQMADVSAEPLGQLVLAALALRETKVEVQAPPPAPAQPYSGASGSPSGIPAALKRQVRGGPAIGGSMGKKKSSGKRDDNRLKEQVVDSEGSRNTVDDILTNPNTDDLSMEDLHEKLPNGGE